MSASLSLDSEGCPPFEYDVYGRQGIGVVQPESGIDYPLVAPSEDIRHLLADFQLHFDDPGFYGGEPFVPPYRIHWLYGVGCTGEAPSCSSSSGSLGVEFCPTHAADLTVVDQDDRVVFHSPDAAEFLTRTWGDRLRVYEWKDPRNGTCLLVVHTKWPVDQSNYVARHYAENFFPDEATLDPRTVLRLPKRVRSLTLILDTIARKPVEFQAGYNILFDNVAQIQRGLRRVNQVRINAGVGQGLGIYPGCEPEPLVIRTINNVAPTEHGDFYMDALACNWVRQPTRVTSTTPRLTLPEIALTPGSVPEEGLPDPAAGVSKNAAGWPPEDSPQYAHLQFGNDCQACCDCDDYVAVANYMNAIGEKYTTVGANAEATHALYAENLTRWIAARKCLLRRPLRIALQPQTCPFLDVGIQFCNNQDVCLQKLVLTVNLFTSPGDGIGLEVPGYTFITGAASKPGRRSARTDRYKMGGTWPEFTAFFDVVNPGQSVSAKFRLYFDSCGLTPGSGSLSSSSSVLVGEWLTPYAVTGVLTGTLDDDPIVIPLEAAESSGILEVAEVSASATLNCPAGDEVKTDLRPCF